MKNTNNYWLSPTGEIIPVNWHLDEVVKNPKDFRLTKKRIKEIFCEHEEESLLIDFYRPSSSECARIPPCRAEVAIFEQVLQNGWIYIIYNEKLNRYIIELNNLTNKAKENIQKWANELLKIKPDSLYSDVHIYDLFYESHYLDYTDDEKPSFYNEHEWRVMIKHPLLFVDSVHDCLGIRHHVRYKIFVQRMVGWEISNGEKVTKSVFPDILNDIKLAHDYNCLICHISNGIFVISSTKPNIPISILAATRE